MKVISVIQPWAQLLALGEKRYETRHWQTFYRGPIAIHASRQTDEALYMCRMPSYWRLLEKHGIAHTSELGWGAIIATATLIACHPTSYDFWKTLHGNEQEVMLGDFSGGRYAWELRDVRLLPEPIPARGKPGLWDFDDALIRKAVA